MVWTRWDLQGCIINPMIRVDHISPIELHRKTINRIQHYMHKKKAISLYDSAPNHKSMNPGECRYFWTGVEKKRDRKSGSNYLKKPRAFYRETSIHMWIKKYFKFLLELKTFDCSYHYFPIKHGHKSSAVLTRNNRRLSRSKGAVTQFRIWKKKSEPKVNENQSPD